MPVNESTSSGSSQLVGGIPTVPETQEGATEQETPRMSVARPCNDRSKANLLQEEEEEEEVGPQLPLQSGQEEPIQTITLQLVSQVKITGIGDAGGQRED